MSSQRASLLSLPDELLVRVFEHLRAEPTRNSQDLRSTSLTCHRLHAPAYVVLYRDVTFTWTERALARFAESLKHNPDLESLVRRFSYEHRHISDDDTTRQEDAVRTARLAALLEHVCSKLSSLHELHLSSVDVATCLTVASAQPYPTLRTFSLATSLKTHEVGAWRLFWMRLRSYPNLKRLDLLFTTLRRSVHEPSSVPDIALVQLPQLRHLVVCTDAWILLFGSRVPFAHLAPNLTKLVVEATPRKKSWSSAASLISDLPPSLANLAISTNKPFGPPPPGFLQHAQHVRDLQLGAGTFDESELSNFLSRSPAVRHIRFNYYGAKVTDNVLQALTVSSRPPSLERISLEHVMATGTDVLARDLDDITEGKHTDDVAYARLRQNLRPHLPPGSTVQGLQTAVDAARAADIAIEGRALSALDWDILFDNEVKHALMRHAVATDRYDRVVERFGAGEVTAWLRKHRPNTLRLGGALDVAATNTEGA
ncbi:hypothetical protein JCM10908_006247 [Rhodotorula pacifica]|uniref:F-box protein n=1 Tax=Rhodotorula pacifica TaxID=1495444 RepID=UPI00317CC164